MKPFDLQAALAGEPVVTRDGRPVKIAGYNPESVLSPIIGWVNNQPWEWGVGGIVSKSHETHLDLFMAEKPKFKKEGWVNVYQIFECYEDAKAMATPSCHMTIKIEWEEEAD